MVGFSIIGKDAYGINIYHAFLYDGSIHDLGTLGGSFSEAWGINNLGQITGRSTNDINSFNHAFLYQSGTMHGIETAIGPTETQGFSINDHGQVTGTATFLNGDNAFIYDGDFHNIGGLGGSYASGTSINNHGNVAGWSLTASAGTHAFFYDGEMHDLGTLGRIESYALAINDSNVVVGLSNFDPSDYSDFRAFIYTTASGLVDLNSLIDPQSGGFARRRRN